MAEIQEAALLDALRECYDPEIPVNIVDLGLVYGVEVDEGTSHVQVTMTFTALGCPVAGDIITDIERRVCEVENVKSCKVELTDRASLVAGEDDGGCEVGTWHGITSLLRGRRGFENLHGRTMYGQPTGC